MAGKFDSSSYLVFIRNICYRCRSSNCYIQDHKDYRFSAGYKWRIPKKNNDKAWKRIESGDHWWDQKAIADKAIKQSERLRKYWNNLKVKNRKGDYEA